MINLIPQPASLMSNPGGYRLSSSTTISAPASSQELQSLAKYLSEQLHTSTGQKPTILDGDGGGAGIALLLDPSLGLGEEGYELSISEQGVRLQAGQPAGLFYAIQSLLQLIPAGSSGDLSLPAVSIRDTPRFEWRGAMLDVARHFFGVEDVKRFIDLIAHYKINRLHLHLTDDQGWRIEIKSRPRLTEIGGRTQVGGNGGGYYTQEQYKDIVEYARSRFITIIPEIDSPGHTNAALAAYAELNPSGQAPGLYEGTEVGFSSFWIDNEVTYRFLEDVIAELAALTPAPYIHIGGDEARSTPEDQYKRFIKRIQEIVAAHGKRSIGWSENIGEADILPGTIAQHWFGAGYQDAREKGARIILSPANKVYLDMKYDESTTIGLSWAGLISVKDAYDWDPGSYMHLLDEKDILGIEAPLWTETVLTMKDIEYMVFPRLPGIAELAWSPRGQTWEEYRNRLAAHGPRMHALGINFYKAPEVDWK